MQLLTFISDVSQKYICLIPFTISCQQETKTQTKNPSRPNKNLWLWSMCVKFQLNDTLIFFKSLAFQTSNKWIGTENPPSPVQPLCDRCPPLYPAFTGPFLSARHPHLMNHYQSHLNRIQIPKIDANTVSSTWSLGILSKLWINWHTELALRRVTLSSVTEVMAWQYQVQASSDFTKCSRKWYQDTPQIQLKLRQTYWSGLRLTYLTAEKQRRRRLHTTAPG